MTTVTPTDTTTTRRLHSRPVCVTVRLLLLLLLLLPQCVQCSTSSTSSFCSFSRHQKSILVVGSANVDTILTVERWPVAGENVCIVPGTQPERNLPGGKGCTQAIAAAKLLQLNHHHHQGHSSRNRTTTTTNDEDEEEGESASHNDDPTTTSRDQAVVRGGVTFIGQFGSLDSDPAETILRRALAHAGVHVPTVLSRTHPHLLCGRGYVFNVVAAPTTMTKKNHTEGSGAGRAAVAAVAAVVSGGSNRDGWADWQPQLSQQDHELQHSRDDKNDRITQQQQRLLLLQQIRDLLFPPRQPPLLQQEQQQQKDEPQPHHEKNEDESPTSSSPKPPPRVVILLQCEIPEHVNRCVMEQARRPPPHYYNNNNNKKNHNDVIILQDVGGEDRSMDPDLIAMCDYLMPNESELVRLVQSLDHKYNHTPPPPNSQHEDDAYHPPDAAFVVACSRRLQRVYGARNVLVTQGSRGCTLVTESSGPVLTHEAFSIQGQGDEVIDETGAGDCFRAAFAVALLEGKALPACLEFASAAGACAVTRKGAVPATPTRQEVDDRIHQHDRNLKRQSSRTITGSPILTTTNLARATTTTTTTVASSESLQFDSSPSSSAVTGDESKSMDPHLTSDIHKDDDFPFLIGSRLNSMKDRPELWSPRSLESTYDYVQRQKTIKGLTCVDFNYPQHFVSTPTHHSKSKAKTKTTTTTTIDLAAAVEQVQAALHGSALRPGAVCLRYPHPRFARGAMNHPEAHLRHEALQMTLNAAHAAVMLGCREVVVWSAFDGYDYPFQVDYDTQWTQLVEAFQQCCDAFPQIKWSIEYKPTDENTRFFTVPSTGAALWLVHAVNRTNFGLTLDVGHMLMAGENPGQSIAMVAGRASGAGNQNNNNNNKLFGIQLNDGYTRLAAEDGLMFGSVHPAMALEIMYQLRRIRYTGHIYFDTFPQRSDPVQEAEYNIRRVKAFWRAAGNIEKNSERLQRIVKEHDAIGALELVDAALRSM